MTSMPADQAEVVDIADARGDVASEAAALVRRTCRAQGISERVDDPRALAVVAAVVVAQASRGKSA